MLLLLAFVKARDAAAATRAPEVAGNGRAGRTPRSTDR
jgi:hypothetical protein